MMVLQKVFRKVLHWVVQLVHLSANMKALQKADDWVYQMAQKTAGNWVFQWAPLWAVKMALPRVAKMVLLTAVQMAALRVLLSVDQWA